MKYRMVAGTVLGLVAVVFLAASWMGSAQGRGDALLKPDDQALVAQGKTIYANSCASCHGVDLKGQVEDWRSPGPDGLMPAPPHDESGHTWHHPDEVLFAITRLGIARAANLKDYKSAMPAYEGVLSDQEIVAVLSYIKSIWPKDIRAGHDEMNRRYALERPESR